MNLNIVFGDIALPGVATIIDAEAERRLVLKCVPPHRPSPGGGFPSFRSSA